MAQEAGIGWLGVKGVGSRSGKQTHTHTHTNNIIHIDMAFLSQITNIVSLKRERREDRNYLLP